MDLNEKPFEELTREEIEQLKQEEAAEAPSTAKADGAWGYNSSFTGVKLRYSTNEEYLQSLADKANTSAENYLELREEAMHFIANQTMFDFDKPVDNFVLGIVKELGTAKYREIRKKAAQRLASLVYPVARKMIPKKLLDAYQIYPDAIIRMEGLHLYYSYIGLDGEQRFYNAWLELDLPAYLTSKDIHDEIKRMSEDNELYGKKIELAVRNAHKSAMLYRKRSFKMMLKLIELKKMTYGGFANTYPVTFKNVCDYITKMNLNATVEENAETHGAIAKGFADKPQTNF